MATFFVNPENSKRLPSSSFVLESSTWDDYSNKTSFSLSYIDSNEKIIYIGAVKIAHKTEKTTVKIIPLQFAELPDEYCSLGQEIEYYEKLRHLFSSNFLSILDNLNDAAFFPAVREVFENHKGFRDSLLRSSEAEKALNEAHLIVNNIPIDQAFHFTYSCQLAGAEDNHTVDFNFADISSLPNRIIALVGKNGTGKTQFMAKLAVDLGGQGRRKRTQDTFIPHRPLFSKIIAISYSAFDKFSRPDKNKALSYKYCGLRDENGFIGLKKIVENYKEAVTKIKEAERTKDWQSILSSIMGIELVSFYFDEIFEKENYEVINQSASKLLSSGQSFLMYVLTEVIASIRKDSLLLFDEPEMHLHPNAIANLIRTIDRILNIYDSYAILATHSPIIIQEIPSRYVFVFERQGNVPVVRNLGIQCLMKRFLNYLGRN